MFGLSSFNQPTISMGDVKNWAASVRDKHLNDGADPTAQLIKIASEQGLTPHQVGVLAGEINKTIHTAKYASADDKYHAANFPLADAQKAIEALQIGDGGEKVAFQMPDPKTQIELDYNAAFGIKPEDLQGGPQEKTGASAIANSRLRGEVKVAGMKLAHMKAEQDRVAFMSKVAADEAEIAFIKTAWDQIVREVSHPERWRVLGVVAHATKCAGLYDAARKPLAKIALSLAEQGLVNRDKAEEIAEYFLEKSADEVAPQELISEFLRAKVINGNHPLIITLKTFRDHCDVAQDEANRKKIIDDRNLIFAQKVRAL